jgi:hypothetical protein
MFILCLISPQIIYAQNNIAQLGEQLERKLFTTVQNQDWSTLENMIGQGFQSVNADQIRDRTRGIEYMKSLRFKDYSFYNFKVTQDSTGKILIVTYEVTYSETVNQTPQAGKLTKNLSVWENINNKWMLLAHAVLD